MMAMILNAHQMKIFGNHGMLCHRQLYYQHSQLSFLHIFHLLNQVIIQPILQHINHQLSRLICQQLSQLHIHHLIQPQCQQRNQPLSRLGTLHSILLQFQVLNLQCPQVFNLQCLQVLNLLNCQVINHQEILHSLQLSFQLQYLQCIQQICHRKRHQQVHQ